MENYEMFDTEFEEMVADEMFPETNNAYDSENFPTKDRSRSAARRKKDHAKGKKRVETLYAKTKDWTKYPKRNEAVLRGVLRDTTSVIKQPKENFNRSAIRRQLSVKDKITEYGFEGAEKPLIVREA